MATHACFLFLMLSSMGRAQLRGMFQLKSSWQESRLGFSLDHQRSHGQMQGSVELIKNDETKTRVTLNDAAANGDQNTLCERLIHGRV
ncbi:hypothetical protein L210DRAFT_3555911 [Boletus edulis BED1]|uniref:Uncharacterized protein n=1 Tax=Boletus edulis BED1 TaxID=1328754 RepID=A0AAD4BL52_BOLED|nr:hypothetical protein L210DRAFT_3555911 [Boletus edulis BED1]